MSIGKDRGKPPGVHDPTRTRTPEGYVPLPRGKGYVRGTSGTPGYVGYPGVGKRNAMKVHPQVEGAVEFPESDREFGSEVVIVVDAGDRLNWTSGALTALQLTIDGRRW